MSQLFEIARRNIWAYQVIPQNPLNLTKPQIALGAMRPRLRTSFFWTDARKRHTINTVMRRRDYINPALTSRAL